MPYVNLKAPDEHEFAIKDPHGFLVTCKGGAIIDEIQRVSELTSWIQVRADESARPGQFLLTGSHNFRCGSF